MATSASPTPSFRWLRRFSLSQLSWSRRDSGYWSNYEVPREARLATGPTLYGFTSWRSLPRLWEQEDLYRLDERFSDEELSAYMDLKRQFDGLNRYVHEHVQSRHTGFITMKLQRLAKSKHDLHGQLWILIYCHPVLAKHVKTFCNDTLCSGRRRDVVCWNVLVCDKGPRFLFARGLSLSLSDASQQDSGLLLQRQQRAVCGRRIRVRGHEGENLARAGGLLSCVEPDGTTRIYIMTVDHVLGYSGSEDPFEDRGVEVYDTRTIESLCDKLGRKLKVAARRLSQKYFARTVHNPTAQCFPPYHRGVPNAQMQAELLKVPNDSEHDDGAKLDNWLPLDYVNHVDTITAEQPDLDWALFSANQAHHELFSSVHKWSSITLRLPSNRHAQESRPVRVLTGASCTILGDISFCPSFVNLRSTGPCAEIYVMRLRDASELRQGDCGAWVVDQETGEVYGHVIASDASGDIYVVPFADALRQIRIALGAQSICLPTDADCSSVSVSNPEYNHNEVASTRLQPSATTDRSQNDDNDQSSVESFPGYDALLPAHGSQENASLSWEVGLAGDHFPGPPPMPQQEVSQYNGQSNTLLFDLSPMHEPGHVDPDWPQSHSSTISYCSVIKHRSDTENVSRARHSPYMSTIREEISADHYRNRRTRWSPDNEDSGYASDMTDITDPSETPQSTRDLEKISTSIANQGLEWHRYVFLIDDSASMNAHWKELTSLLMDLTSVLKPHMRSKTLDYHFACRKFLPHAASEDMAILHKKLRQRRPDQGFKYRANIEDALEDILLNVEAIGCNRPRHKTIVCIFTDGSWHYDESAITTTDDLIRHYSRPSSHKDNIAIHFVHFGEDKEVATRLQHFKGYPSGLPRNIVAVEPSTGDIGRMLLGHEVKAVT